MNNKLLQLIGFIILIIGMALIIISYSYPIYSNEKVYQDKYMQLSGEEGDSEKFYKLRDEYLTPKYKLENYGITSIIIGFAILTISFIGLNKFKTPNKKIWIVIIGIIAALLTNLADVGDLYLEMHRGSYPHWADSLGIPLMAVPSFIVISLVWVSINLVGIIGNFKTGVTIFPIRLENTNKWYLVILFLTIILTVLSVISGDFWMVFPGILWTYFYLSIILGKSVAKVENISLSKVQFDKFLTKAAIEKTYRLEFLEEFLKLYGVSEVKYNLITIEKVYGTAIYVLDDPEEIQQFCWSMNESNVPPIQVLDIIKVVNENNWCDIDKIIVPEDELFEKIGWKDRQLFDKYYDLLFEVDIRMVDDGEETDGFWVHN
jgi:hypothetical protein